MLWRVCKCESPRNNEDRSEDVKRKTRSKECRAVTNGKRRSRVYRVVWRHSSKCHLASGPRANEYQSEATRITLVKRECPEELQCKRKMTYGATDCRNTQPQRLTPPGVVSDTAQSRELILHVSVPRASPSQLRTTTVRISVRKNSTLWILSLETRGCFSMIFKRRRKNNACY